MRDVVQTAPDRMTDMIQQEQSKIVVPVKADCKVSCWFNPFDAHCCHMGTAAIKYHVPDRVKSSFVIFDIRAL